MTDVRLPPTGADSTAAGVKEGDDIEVSTTAVMFVKLQPI